MSVRLRSDFHLDFGFLRINRQNHVEKIHGRIFDFIAFHFAFGKRRLHVAARNGDFALLRAFVLFVRADFARDLPPP